MMQSIKGMYCGDDSEVRIAHSTITNPELKFVEEEAEETDKSKKGPSSGTTLLEGGGILAPF